MTRRSRNTMQARRVPGTRLHSSTLLPVQPGAAGMLTHTSRRVTGHFVLFAQSGCAEALVVLIAIRVFKRWLRATSATSTYSTHTLAASTERLPCFVRWRRATALAYLRSCNYAATFGKPSLPRCIRRTNVHCRKQ
eukprot:8487915-Pyramimonas_sp.AAC.2